MREGGGISFTVEQTKLATDKELLCGLVARLNRMLCAGESLILPIVCLIFFSSFVRYNLC
jgi:hypothetical protein